MEPSDPIVIVFYVIAAISTICSIYACIAIAMLPSRATAKKIILYLHSSLIVEEIVFLPFAYVGDSRLCSAMGFFHAYAALSNLIAMWLVTIYGVNYIRFENQTIDKLIYRYKELLVFVFPIITVFPFILDDYGEQGDAWCELVSYSKTESRDAALGIVFYYFWVWFFILFSLIVIIGIVIDSCRKAKGFSIAKSVMSSIGGYGVIALISWLPYSIRKLLHERTTDVQALGLTIPIYVTGILYALLYIYNPSIVQLPDKAHIRESTIEFKMSDLEAIVMNPLPSMDGSRMTTTSLENDRRFATTVGGTMNRNKGAVVENHQFMTENNS
jgi:hypothetical protein